MATSPFQSPHIGTLYGISAGPGDPELITLKALKLLQRVPIVAFPAGRDNRPGMAEKIVTPWLLAGQQKLPLYFPYVQEEETLEQAWQEAAEQVWLHLQQGEDVAFACEGDISFYSTFTYLAQTLTGLHPEVAIQGIGGVCSPLASAAALGIPLTVRSQRLAVLPALYSLRELETALEWADVVVLMKVSSVYQQVWQVLQERQLLERAWVVERATLPQQVTYSHLEQYPQLDLSYFSLLLVQVQPQEAEVNLTLY